MIFKLQLYITFDWKVLKLVFNVSQLLNNVKVDPRDADRADLFGSAV